MVRALRIRSRSRLIKESVAFRSQSLSHTAQSTGGPVVISHKKNPFLGRAFLSLLSSLHFFFFTFRLLPARSTLDDVPVFPDFPAGLVYRKDFLLGQSYLCVLRMANLTNGKFRCRRRRGGEGFVKQLFAAFFPPSFTPAEEKHNSFWFGFF